MCRVSKRGSSASPGNSPPKNMLASHWPTNGIDCAIEYAMRRPTPESRSSGSEYPVNPAPIPAVTSPTPISQLISRGLRNAPVKNTRIMCATIAAMKISADQWWVCRITSPARTSNESWSTEL